MSADVSNLMPQLDLQFCTRSTLKGTLRSCLSASDIKVEFSQTSKHDQLIGTAMGSESSQQNLDHKQRCRGRVMITKALPALPTNISL